MVNPLDAAGFAVSTKLRFWKPGVFSVTEKRVSPVHRPWPAGPSLAPKTPSVSVTPVGSTAAGSPEVTLIGSGPTPVSVDGSGAPDKVTVKGTPWFTWVGAKKYNCLAGGTTSISNSPTNCW